MAELLAPAGTYEAIQAAVAGGADAVYFGSSKFNARLRARNFEGELFQKAINFCHSQGVKAYITVNTLIFENELNDLAKLISEISLAGADAIIVQDFAAYSLAKQIAPHLRIHASTQMTIHNSSSAKFLASLGFSRINLARELSLEEVQAIKKNSGIEVETFVHGALCFSYSGQCLFSYMQMKRSGNRGLCSQLCRLPWELYHDKTFVKKGYLSNSKDLNLLPHIPQLLDAGIDSFKVEGRMKNPEYIYAVVSAYRKMIDDNEPTDLSRIFSRGYTTGYYFGNPGPSLINPNDPGYKGEPIGKVLSVSKQGAVVTLTKRLSAGDGIRTQMQNRVTIVNDIYDAMGKKHLNAVGGCILHIRELKKGDTIYRAFNAPVKNLASIARKNTSGITLEKPQTPLSFKLAEFVSPKFDSQLFRLPKASELSSISKGSKAILPLSEITKEAVESAHARNVEIFADTPRVIKDSEFDSLLSSLDSTLLAEPDGVFLSNLGLLDLASPKILSHQFNITNSQSAALMAKNATELRGIVSSVELSPAEARAVGLIPYSYGTVELMVSEHDLIGSMCKPDCPGNHFLRDPNGNRFRVLRENKRSVVLSAAPIAHEDRKAPCFIDLKYEQKK